MGYTVQCCDSKGLTRSSSGWRGVSCAPLRELRLPERSIEGAPLSPAASPELRWACGPVVWLGGSERPATGSAAETPTGAASGSAGPAGTAGCLLFLLGRVLLAGGAGCTAAGAPAAPVPLLLRVRLAGPEASVRSASLRLAACLVSITLSRHGASQSFGGPADVLGSELCLQAALPSQQTP
jgi:hypothetical protein